jgi:hypothetical protein
MLIMTAQRMHDDMEFVAAIVIKRELRGTPCGRMDAFDPQTPEERHPRRHAALSFEFYLSEHVTTMKSQSRVVVAPILFLPSPDCHANPSIDPSWVVRMQEQQYAMAWSRTRFFSRTLPCQWCLSRPPCHETAASQLPRFPGCSLFCTGDFLLTLPFPPPSTLGR